MSQPKCIVYYDKRRHENPFKRVLNWVKEHDGKIVFIREGNSHLTDEKQEENNPTISLKHFFTVARDLKATHFITFRSSDISDSCMKYYFVMEDFCDIGISTVLLDHLFTFCRNGNSQKNDDITTMALRIAYIDNNFDQKKITESDREIIERLAINGFTPMKIANLFSIEKQSIKSAFKKWKLPTGKHVKINEIHKSIIENMVINGDTIHQIAKEFNCNALTVQKRLKEWNMVTTRKKELEEIRKRLEDNKEEITKLLKEKAIKKKKKISLKKISNRFNVSYSTIQKIYKKIKKEITMQDVRDGNSQN